MKSIFFDLDGTLIRGYLDRADKNYHAIDVLPRRREILADLIRQGITIGIVTNQGGIAFGYNSEADFATKLAGALDALGLPSTTVVAVCFSDVRGASPYNSPLDAARRKPSGSMIEELMKQCGTGPLDTIFVGDRPEDEDAAINAGCRFEWAMDFFC